MARPSRQLDQALLQAGRALYPRRGCAGLTVRAVAEAAGVTPAMFHYHFPAKAHFLRAVLQQLYEDFYATLSLEPPAPAGALERLRAALLRLVQFLRAHRAVVGRVVMDVAAGEPVARAFVQENAPRHLALLMRLMADAEAEGGLRPMPPLQRFTFVLGAVVAPSMVVGALTEAAIAPPEVALLAPLQVLDDAAVIERIDLALAALMPPATPGAHPPRSPA